LDYVKRSESAVCAIGPVGELSGEWVCMMDYLQAVGGDKVDSLRRVRVVCLVGVRESGWWLAGAGKGICTELSVSFRWFIFYSSILVALLLPPPTYHLLPTLPTPNNITYNCPRCPSLPNTKPPSMMRPAPSPPRLSNWKCPSQAQAKS
jgi:hypothetical protein